MKQITLFLLLCVSLSIFGQSPWTKKKKEAYLQLSYTTIPKYTELFGDPVLNTEREINDNTLQFFTEYGLTDKTTLIVNLPLKFVSSNALVDVDNTSPVTIEDSKTTLGNIQLGLKHKFIHKKWLLSGQLSVEANTTSEFEEASGLRTGYDAWTTEWLWIAAFIDGVASLKNGEIEEPNSNILTGLYVNDQSFGGYGFKFSFGANLGIGGAFSGANVAKTPAISLGLYLKI